MLQKKTHSNNALEQIVLKRAIGVEQNYVVYSFSYGKLVQVTVFNQTYSMIPLVSNGLLQLKQTNDMVLDMVLVRILEQNYQILR